MSWVDLRKNVIMLTRHPNAAASVFFYCGEGKLEPHKNVATCTADTLPNKSATAVVFPGNRWNSTKVSPCPFRARSQNAADVAFLGKATTPQNCCEVQQQLILVTKLELNKKNVAMLLASQNAAEGVSWET